MDLWTALSRAKRGLRDDLRLHVIAIASLVVAFLCLGAALLSVQNLSRIAERWGGQKHLTVYLKDGAQEGDVAQLRLVLESLPDAEKVRHVSAADARKEFAEQADMGVQIGALPQDAFPASLEVALRSRTSEQRVGEIAERVRRFGAVEDVETYHDWFSQMGTLLSAGKSAVALLAMLVVVCVLAVIGNTIRLAVANRRREIEVLKLCGATDSFVRSPFVIEGVIQAVTASTLAMVLLCLAYLALHTHVDATLTQLAGVKLTFLPPLTLLGTVLAAGFV